MQIHHRLPPTASTPLPAADASATGSERQAAASSDVPLAGVQYIPSAQADVPDLNSLSLEQQLQLGQRMGMFTKITYSKDGQMTAHPFASQSPSTDPYAGIAAPGFVRGAASAMRDFEEGMAALRARAPGVDSKGGDSWVRALQSAAARLNVFA